MLLGQSRQLRFVLLGEHRRVNLRLTQVESLFLVLIVLRLKVGNLSLELRYLLLGQRLVSLGLLGLPSQKGSFQCLDVLTLSL